jgi:hypothetical protein
MEIFKKISSWFLNGWEKKLTILSILIFIFGSLLWFSPRDIDLYKYYNILDDNEKVTDYSEDEVKRDLSQLYVCGRFGKGGDKCYLNFYKTYTIKNGPEKALKHLILMMAEDPGVLPGCHYISHGIGEGFYVRNNYDLAKSYRFDVSKYFRNVGACGNGFYHGISIGLTKQVRNEKELADIFRDYCDDPEKQGNAGKENCNHGIGHAVTSYFDSDIAKSMAFCSSLFPEAKESFGCLTGVQMDEEVALNSYGLLDYGLDALNKVCSIYVEGTLERQACIVERAGRLVLTEDKKTELSFLERAKLCNQLPNKTERKACGKLTLIHAIRFGRSQEAKETCKQLEDKAGVIECTAFAALYLALAVDVKRGDLYNKITDETCRTLNYYDYLKCRSLYNRGVNTFDSSVDYGRFLNWSDIVFLSKRLYKKGSL